MYSKTLTTQFTQTAQRTIAGIVLFTAITALTADVRIPFEPVPITFQPLAVMLSGLVLGARGGAMAQLLYVGLIAMGLPLDTNALGTAVFFGPTAGFLVGFIPAAFVAGWLAERFAPRSWWGHFIAALVGMSVIYLCGVPWLSQYVGGLSTALSAMTWFIAFDVVKAIVAAGAAESGKYWRIWGRKTLIIREYSFFKVIL